ncbi:MAG: hypothetical protein J0M08_07730 [Bacteroidetes bacterium]|nr:hypothetical protein [Bacteroidota bacterium]
MHQQVFKSQHVKGFLNLLMLFFVLAAASCSLENSRKSTNSGKVVAKAYDDFLYESEVLPLVTSASSRKDTVDFINSYADRWVKQQILLRKAEQNLSEEDKDVSAQLEDYRQSLVIYKYENQLVHQKLDTVISAGEIEEYYNQNSQNFELKNNIIKVVYVKVSKKAPDLTKLKNWYKSDVEKDIKQLEDYCRKYADNYYLDDNTWLLFADILKEVPIETYNQELFLKNNRFVEVQDSLNLYLLNIKGFKIKNSISPLAFEKENIKNIIINRRKIELIEKMKEDLYKSINVSKEIEVTKYE